MTRQLPHDVARCYGHEPIEPNGKQLDIQCVDCLRRTAEWNPIRQVVMTVIQFRDGKCEERIAPDGPFHPT